MSAQLALTWIGPGGMLGPRLRRTTVGSARQPHLGSSAATRGRPRWSLRVAASMVCLGVVLAGCTGRTPTSAEPKLHRVPFDAANFVDPTLSTNRWHPTKPGTKWVRTGTTEVGSRTVPHQVVTTMTDVIREIDGVKTIAMLDQETDAGQISQVSIDYFGLDKEHNVWLLGGYTEAYQGGQFTNTTLPWLGKESGGEPGILMPANPVKTTPRWFIDKNSLEEGSAAEVVDTGQSQCVEFACYKNVLVIREGKVEGIDNEFKYYASGVGLILNTPRRESSHKDTEALANLSQLTPRGLSEASNEVLRLEAHARVTEPKTFGSAPPAKRAR
jgi:hypothetical protein